MNHAEAHHNLGTIEIAFQHFESGLEHLRQAIELAPKIDSYWLSLVEGLLTAQQTDEARLIIEQAYGVGVKTPEIRALRKRFVAKPKKPAPVVKKDHFASLAQHQQVVDLLNQGQLAEAEIAAHRLVDCYPNDAFGWKAMGTLLCKRNAHQEALTMLLKAISLAPQDAECFNNLGNPLQRLGRLNEALDCFNRALAINPEYAEAHNSKGVVLKDMGRIEKAIASYHCALALNPNLIDAHNNLGAALKEIERLDEALECYQRALALNPDYAMAYNNLGSALQEFGRLDEAIVAYDKAVQLNPKLEFVYSNRLFALNYHPDKPASEIFTAYREFDRRFSAPLRSSWRAHDNNRDLKRCLRVGYVSPDFNLHPVYRFLEPLLAHHDKDIVEVTAYTELTCEDKVTARYRKHVDHWVSIRGLSDAEVVQRIRADKIDILVDLAGHTANNRLGVFSHRPAPIAVSWLGYGYTTGLSAIDYFLTDEIMVPVGSEKLFAEQPWRITAPAMVYRPDEHMGEVNALPALQRGFITFGTLTRGIRINHHTIRAWSAILQRVAGARLVIDSRNFITKSVQNMLVERFAVHGITADRLEINYHSPPWDVLRGMDIALDCFPHNSGTTLIESLYLGIPFITLAARPSVGRIGSTILHGAGHSEWIANSEDEYIEKAVALTNDLPRLAAIRAHLRAELAASPWRDEVGFAQRVEQAYRDMWQCWCANACLFKTTDSGR